MSMERPKTAPRGELHPLDYRPIPSTEQMLKGETGGYGFIAEALEPYASRITDGWDEPTTLSFLKSLLEKLIHQVDELPGLGMAAYWAITNYESRYEVRFWDGTDLKSVENLYRGLAVMQRNRFRWVFMECYGMDWREDVNRINPVFKERLGQSRPLLPEAPPGWDYIEVLDEVLEEARQSVLSME